MDGEDAAALVSPPDVTTPPAVAGGKRGHPNGADAAQRTREGSEAVDPEALSRALKEYEDASVAREKTPSGSPSRKRPRLYADR